ncbi:hypothetical protein OEZ85_011098 [Tetradesmus obliquus]|uniref:C2H2-type domain-containing protein n=1 Tax=Tetradesmus obliquus TaxID=3088 RepID=A0ABY8TP88_TETOB|nr:hypothetical protein OEZ85_011098 [Tetradesmus obliquus]
MAGLRFVMEDSKCMICKQECPQVFFTRYLGDFTEGLAPDEFQDLPARARAREVWELPEVAGYFDDQDHYKAIKSLCSYTHPMLPGAVCGNLNSLKRKLTEAHKLHFCDLCIKGRKVFISEQVLYSKSDLERHMRTGDDEGPMAESGFKGHPLCRFCRQRFYDGDELYKHMEGRHENCFICRRRDPNKFVYYKDYAELEEHFTGNHHPCPHPACLERKFVVFAEEAELKRHFATEHGGEMNLSRAQRRNLLTVNIQLNYAREQEEAAAAAAAAARPGVVIGGGHNLPRRGGMRHSRSEGAMAAAVAASIESSQVENVMRRSAAEAGGAAPGSVTFNADDFPTVSGQGSGAAPLGTWVGATGGPGSSSLTQDDFPALPTIRQAAAAKAGKAAGNWPAAAKAGSSSSGGGGGTQSVAAAVAAAGGVSEELKAANKALIERCKALLSEAGFKAFREQSGAFMQGGVTAGKYHSHCVELGLTSLVPQLAALCPDADKRGALIAAHKQYLEDSQDSMNAAAAGGMGWVPPEAALAALQEAITAGKDRWINTYAVGSGMAQGVLGKPSSRLVVQLAPGAVAEDDINPNGACKEAIASQCQDVELGDSQVADCLSQVAQAAEFEGDASAKLSDECNEEVMAFKINRNSNINKNLPLAKACASDAEKYCKDMQWYSGYRNGSVIGCLREVKDKLQAGCRKEVFKVQLDAAYDYRADQMLHEACEKDAETLCKGVKNGGGRIQACLRQQRMKLSNWDCEYQLFRKELEDADDLRLSVRMFHACLADKKQFCDDVPAGRAMAKQCLEEHREELSGGCREEIDSMIERRVRDFRLDSRLKKACEKDIGNMCAWGGDMGTMDTYDSMVMNCLQDFRDEIKSDACKSQVHKYVELAAQDIRFDVPLADACYNDRMTLCAAVPPGSARVIRCLQSQREKLSVVCRATLFNEEARFSENIDFQYPMKQACMREIDRFCKDVPHGQARVIRCLQDKKSDKNFGKACRSEVERFEQETAKDYRLNYRLYNACKGDIGATCKNACELKEGEICGGKVLACLVENKAALKSDACRKEVFYLEKMEVNDFRIDMALAEACRGDVDKLCKEVQPGEGRVHKCLRDNSAKLSQACKHEEVRMEIKEADNVNLNVGLLRACANERSLFCRGVAPGSARVFRCLAENMASADFGQACQISVMRKLRRREANWRLDPPLRQACKPDVDKLCSAEDTRRSEDGAVKKCMIANHAELSEDCQRELGRSMHMAFFVWQPQALLTAACDDDIQKLCLSKSKGMEVTPGAVAVCISEIVDQMAQSESGQSANRRRLLGDASKDAKQQQQQQQQQQQGRKEQPGKAAEQAKAKAAPAAAGGKAAPAAAKAGSKSTSAAAGSKPASQARVVPKLSEHCFELAVIAEPPATERSFDVQSAAYSMLTSSMEKLESSTGLPTLMRNKQGGVTAVSLTGWTALVGMASLVVVLLAGATLGVRQYLGHARDGYSLVTKQAPPGQ